MTASQTSRMPRVLVAGALTMDCNRTDNRAQQALGGAPVHASRAYIDLGAALTVAFASAETEATTLAALLGADVMLAWQQADVTCTFENVYQSDRERRQRLLRAPPPLRADVAGAAGGFELLHLSPLHPEDLEPAWYCQRHPGLALDVQGLVRRIEKEEVHAGADRQLGPALTHAAFIKANEAEWETLAAALSLTVSDLLLTATDVCITRGQDGGHWYGCDGSFGSWTAAAAAADPTGAGDMFFATYLVHRWLGRDRSASASAAAGYVDRVLASGRDPPT